MDALLDFRTEVTLDGETLSAAEIEWLLAQSDGLAFMRGRWIEVDRERLSRTLEQFEMSNDARSPRVCRSAKRCACWQEPALPRMGPPDTPTLTGAKPWPVPGWPRRSRPCAVPIAPLSTLVDLSGEHSGTNSYHASASFSSFTLPALGAAVRSLLSFAIPPPILADCFSSLSASGVQWLRLLAQLGLGACLADERPDA